MEAPCNPCEIEVRASSGSKRVTARRPAAAQHPPPGTPLSLLQKELSGWQPLQRAHWWHSFSHFQLQQEFDLYAQHGGGDGGGAEWWPPFYLRRRSAVREVLAAEGLVIALADSGVCTAFNQDSGVPLCFLNVEADEIIRSLFINPLNGTLITVSVFSGDAFQGLRVRSNPLGSIRQGRPHCWRPLFTSEVLCWPGFIEFDDVSNVIVTCSADSRRFKVWDMRLPLQPLFHIDSHDVRDFKIAAGCILLTMQPERAGELRLRILDLTDGCCAKELHVPFEGGGASSVGDGGGMELIELFGRHLLTKEAGGPLHITDVVTGTVREVSAALFPAPSAFIHLPFNGSFLAFWEVGHAQLWSLTGERLATLAGAALPTATSSNTVFVSNQQELLFVYCPPGSTSSSGDGSGNHRQVAGGGSGDATYAAAVAAAAAGGQRSPPPAADGGGQGPAIPLTSAPAAAGSRGLVPGANGSIAEGPPHHLGCIRVYDLLTGRQVALVQQPSPAGGKQGGQAAASPPLAHVTGLYYDETCHRLYTGTADGKVHAWAL